MYIYPEYRYKPFERVL